MLNLNGLLVFIELEHLEGFFVFQVLIPLPDNWFVLSAHFFRPSLNLARGNRQWDIRGGRSLK
jgi:hypothetical protein